jgi:carboxyl-terminal processing protease
MLPGFFQRRVLAVFCLCFLCANPSLRLSSEEPKASSPSYDLSKTEAFSWVILQMKQDYVNPSRIHPDAMMKRALKYIERRTLEVQISLKNGQADVQAGSNKKSFQVGKPSTIWEMNYALRPIFKFIAENLEPTTDPKDVEFAAINGALSTLDPHSNLLPPELFREMQLKTTGEFGGLGIRITIRKGALTIISPLPDTPAARLGLRAMDQIVRIDDQSTVNMALDEAVNLLRGKAGTKVTIWVMRQGWSEPHKYAISRETIQVQSIVSKLLDRQIGYIQIQDFAKNTAGDLQRHLNELKREAKGLKGLILDLRNNAGGLLKAAVEVADLFLESGIIVATVSYSEDSTPEKPDQRNREEQRATGNAIEKELPIAVLVNSGSASASEILAGALKNLDRALLIGEQTFGKGTVQVLNERVPNAVSGACLKLTVAEYLIPGDVSIQEIGVTPDIQLVPLSLEKEDVSAFAPPERFRERDIPAHLRMHNANVLKPAEVIRYVLDEPTKKTSGDDEEPPLEEPGFKEDFETKLAGDLLLRVRTPKGSAMQDEGMMVIREVQEREEKKVEQKIASLGLDWSSGSGAAPGKAEAQFKLTGEGVDQEGRAKAEQKIRMQLTVKNTGTAPFYRLRAESECKNPLFDRREFLFGRLEPGKSRTWEVPIKVPRGAVTRTDDLRFSFFSEGSQAPAPLLASISTVGLLQPSFGFSWRIVDPEGNGDGLIQPGESVSLELTVYNLGVGKAFDVKALLKNDAGRDLYLEAGKGQISLKEIPAGQSRKQSFVFKVREDCAHDALPVEINIWDSALNATQVEELKIPVYKNDSTKAETILGSLEVTTATDIRGGADHGSPVVAKAKKGVRLWVDRKKGSWYRVLGTTVPAGWIHQEFVSKPLLGQKAKGANDPKVFQPICLLTPPKIQVEPLPPYLKQGESISIKGRVVDEDQDIRDVVVWVNNEKVALFKPDPAASNQRNLEFEQSVSLNPGPNMLSVVAREGTKFSTHVLYVISRPGGLDWKKAEEYPDEEEEDPSLILE